MRICRPSRVLAAFIAIFSLLFAQLAVASYACPEIKAAQRVLVAMNVTAMADCASMDMDQSGLCHSHCKAGHQSPDTSQVPAVQAFVAAGLAVVLVDLPITAAATGQDRRNRLLERATAPPLTIRHCCFRI
jgi:hypothetical protein